MNLYQQNCENMMEQLSLHNNYISMSNVRYSDTDARAAFALQCLRMIDSTEKERHASGHPQDRQS